jgi:3-dehydroquinate synthase
VDVVNRDEREQSLRQVLNLGHTIGHALEEATGYRRFMHGEAVGWGLLAITLMAERMGYLKLPAAPQGRSGRAANESPIAAGDGSDSGRIRRLVWRIGPLPTIRDVSPQAIVRLLPHDKKAVGGKIHWVVPERIGKVQIVTGIPLAEAGNAWKELRALQPFESRHGEDGASRRLTQ